MKRTIYGLILLLTLVLCAGCNKNKKEDTPVTPVSTETPTPTPANPAKVALDKLPQQFDTLMSYQPQTTFDPNKGAGYDVTLQVSLGEQIAALLGLTDLESIQAMGSVDIKESIASNFDLYLNEDKLMNAHLFADSTNLLFNLPAYSADYAAMSWEELLSSVTEEAVVPVPEGNLTDAELAKLLRDHIKDFTECFVAVDGTTENAFIGTGDYLLTGKKHTVRADINDLYAVLESLEAELQTYSEELTFNVEEMKAEGATSFFLEYYLSENGDYAWVGYPDNKAKEPTVFINTALGFCFYQVQADGTDAIALYSEKTTENSGTITLPSSEEDGDDLGTIDYEYSDTSFAMQAMIEDIVLSLEASKVNDTIRYDITVIAEGMSFVIKETVASTYVDLSCTLASYGIEYLTLSVSADSRDYEEIPVPQNTVSLDTWTENLDQENLLTDLMAFLQKYPALASLLLGSTDGPSQDDTLGGDVETGSSTGESVKDSENSADDFTSMKGYSVSDGFVDFFPAESEVLALGKPSTGMDTMAITEDQKNALMDYAKKTILNCEASSDSFYWIWGSIEFQDVKSYYSKDYTFIDSKNSNNSITFAFDAVSGEFASVDIYHEDKNTALAIANEILSLLGIEYTVTAEIAENYTFAKNLSFSGYDGSEYGDTYYNVSFSVYYPVW